MTSERSKRRGLLRLIFITKEYSIRMKIRSKTRVDSRLGLKLGYKPERIGFGMKINPKISVL